MLSKVQLTAASLPKSTGPWHSDQSYDTRCVNVWELVLTDGNAQDRVSADGKSSKLRNIHYTLVSQARMCLLTAYKLDFIIIHYIYEEMGSDFQIHFIGWNWMINMTIKRILILFFTTVPASDMPNHFLIVFQSTHLTPIHHLPITSKGKQPWVSRVSAIKFYLKK